MKNLNLTRPLAFFDLETTGIDVEKVCLTPYVLPGEDAEFGIVITNTGDIPLDVTTDEAGSTSVSARKYITDNIYTDITNNTERGTDISVNIDLTKTLTGRATMAEDGNSSIGLFFERDY